MLPAYRPAVVILLIGSIKPNDVPAVVTIESGAEVLVVGQRLGGAVGLSP